MGLSPEGTGWAAEGCGAGGRKSGRWMDPGWGGQRWDHGGDGDSGHRGEMILTPESEWKTLWWRQRDRDWSGDKRDRAGMLWDVVGPMSLMPPPMCHSPLPGSVKPLCQVSRGGRGGRRCSHGVAAASPGSAAPEGLRRGQELGRGGQRRRDKASSVGATEELGARSLESFRSCRNGVGGTTPRGTVPCFAQGLLDQEGTGQEIISPRVEDAPGGEAAGSGDPHQLRRPRSSSGCLISAPAALPPHRQLHPLRPLHRSGTHRQPGQRPAWAEHPQSPPGGARRWRRHFPPAISTALLSLQGDPRPPPAPGHGGRVGAQPLVVGEASRVGQAEPLLAKHGGGGGGGGRGRAGCPRAAPAPPGRCLPRRSRGPRGAGGTGVASCWVVSWVFLSPPAQEAPPAR